MRIIGGKYGGLFFQPPAGLPARPTTDKSKEALFNILQNRYELAGVEVLDLFSGTGNISFEFASRGADKVTAVEINHKAVKFINGVFEKLQYYSGIAIRSNVFSFIKKCETNFDIIFADPPYAMNNIANLPEKILNTGILKPEGLLIIEHAKQTNLPEEHLIDRREYGQSVFSFYMKKT